MPKGNADSQSLCAAELKNLSLQGNFQNPVKSQFRNPLWSQQADMRLLHGEFHQLSVFDFVASGLWRRIGLLGGIGK